MKTINFKKLFVKDIYHLIVDEPSIIDENCNMEELFFKISENPITRHVYMTNENNELSGSIRLINIAEYLFPDVVFDIPTMTSPITMYEKLLAETPYEIMNLDPISVSMETCITEVIELMIQNHIAELPVVDKQKYIIGEVNMMEVIKYCNIACPVAPLA
ncbi:CBS domain-containing protein [bacterium]|nr:CBS domain-containing protein [bacterium]